MKNKIINSYTLNNKMKILNVEDPEDNSYIKLATEHGMPRTGFRYIDAEILECLEFNKNPFNTSVFEQDNQKFITAILPFNEFEVFLFGILKDDGWKRIEPIQLFCLKDKNGLKEILDFQEINSMYYETEEYDYCENSLEKCYYLSKKFYNLSFICKIKDKFKYNKFIKLMDENNIQIEYRFKKIII